VTIAYLVVSSPHKYRLQNIFLGHPGADDCVTIILQDVAHEDAKRVLEFVYTGAAVVPGRRMDGFVTAAGALGIGPLLDPRRHLEIMSTTARPHRCSPAAAATATTTATDVYEPPRTAVHQPSRVRQPPRITGILTPSPWAQNSRPPCAAPKYSAPRTAAPDPVAVATVVPASITTVVKVSASSGRYHSPVTRVCHRTAEGTKTPRPPPRHRSREACDE